MDQEVLMDGLSPSQNWDGDTPKRLDRLASLASLGRDPRVVVRGVRDQEADQEALMDGPSRSPNRDGDMPKHLDHLASLARD